MNEYEIVRQNKWVGFAHIYLIRCSNESQSNEIIDVKVYKKLIDLDTKLGTTVFEQLFICLLNTTRSDIIKVQFHELFTCILFKSFQIIDFKQVNEYERLRKEGWFGFAHVYLRHCNKDSNNGDNIDVEVYASLVELDTKLGVRSSEQLFWCILLTARWDIIKVRFYTRNKGMDIILDYRLRISPRI